MTIKTNISVNEFKENFLRCVKSKPEKESTFYGKISDDTFSIIQGMYFENEDGKCQIEYKHSKPISDKIFWFVYLILTGFFTLALLKDYPLYSIIAFVLLLFGIVCFLIHPRKFEKKMAKGLEYIAEGKNPESDNETHTDKCDDTEPGKAEKNNTENNETIKENPCEENTTETTDTNKTTEQ